MNFDYYIDALADFDAERALALIDALLREEPDDDVVGLLAHDKLLARLVVLQGENFADRIKALADRTPRWRGLLGGVSWVLNGEERATLAVLADKTAWRTWKENRYKPNEFLSNPSPSVTMFAEAWIKSNDLPLIEAQHDDTAQQLAEFMSEQSAQDPEATLTMIAEIRRQTDNPHLLAYLAAGPLEDLISETSIDAIEREALRNDEFRQLLGGVWTNGMSDDIAARIARLVEAP